MAAPAQLGVYFAVLRKHIPLLLGSAALVVAAGVFYVVRQQPIFFVPATLLVDTPQRNLSATGEYVDMQQQFETELQTQVLLLKENPALARRAVERLKTELGAAVVAAGDYTEITLPQRVKVEPVPGTRCVKFSLTGPDQGSLAAAVNAYAKVFQEWTEEKGALQEDQQRKAFQDAIAAAEKTLRDKQAEQSKLVTEHKDLNLPSGVNADAVEYREDRAAMTSLTLTHEIDAAQSAAIVSALTSCGVTAAPAAGGMFVLSSTDASIAVESRLTENEHAVALKCVQTKDVEQSWIDERAARDTDRRLDEKDFPPTHPLRVKAQQDVAAARTLRGLKMKGAIEMELNAIDARNKQFERMSKRLEELRASSAVVDGYLLQYKNLGDVIQGATREYDRATKELKNYDERYLPDAQSSKSAGASASRRIVMATPAEKDKVEQIAPKVPLIIGLTAFAALAVGLGLVLLIEYLDDTIKSKEDFDRYVRLPFLGFIPRIEAKDADNPDLAADSRSGSAIAEAFRAVRTSILFSRSDKPVRTILVTSAGPGEGKTTVAANLAITLAKHKAPVLLIDADLRRPRVAKALGIENKIGLTNYLVGEATLDDVVQKTSVEGLFAITSGPIPPNPAELLHGERLAQLLSTGLLRFDRIVIDSPPVIAVSDARVIARCTDGLYLVISMGKTSWRLIQRSVESLTSIGFDVQGAILNNLSVPTGRYGYYYYRDYNYGKSYYVQQPPAKEKASAKEKTA